MGRDRTDAYRTVEMVVHIAATHHAVSLFAVDVRGRHVGRRLLWRARLDEPMPVESAEHCLDLLLSAATELKSRPARPWR